MLPLAGFLLQLRVTLVGGVCYFFWAGFHIHSSFFLVFLFFFSIHSFSDQTDLELRGPPSS